MSLMDPNAAERAHHILHRLGMMCGADDPTPAQFAAAEAEALRLWPLPVRPVVAEQATLFQPGGSR